MPMDRGIGDSQVGNAHVLFDVLEKNFGDDGEVDTSVANYYSVGFP